MPLTNLAMKFNQMRYIPFTGWFTSASFTYFSHGTLDKSLQAIWVHPSLFSLYLIQNIGVCLKSEAGILKEIPLQEKSCCLLLIMKWGFSSFQKLLKVCQLSRKSLSIWKTGKYFVYWVTMGLVRFRLYCHFYFYNFLSLLFIFMIIYIWVYRISGKRWFTNSFPNCFLLSSPLQSRFFFDLFCKIAYNAFFFFFLKEKLHSLMYCLDCWTQHTDTHLFLGWILQLRFRDCKRLWVCAHR